jgi:hypothetical protein
MAGNRTTLTVEILAQGAQAAAELNQTASRFESFGKQVGKTVAGVFAGATIAAGVQKAISAASDLQQAMGGVDAVFKQNAKQVHQWASDTSDSIRLPQAEFEELATIIGSQLKNAGVAMDQLAPKTKTLIQLGADLGARFGHTAAEGVSAISSALKGEFDPLDAYGIKLNAAAVNAKALELAQGDAAAAATNQMKAMATLAVITEQSGDAQGAAAAEANTWAGRQEALTEKVTNLAAAVGGPLIDAFGSLYDVAGNVVDVAQPLLVGAANLVKWFTDLPGPVLAAAAALGAMALLKGPLGEFGDVFKRFGENLAVQQSLAAMQGENISKIGAAASVAATGVKGLGKSLLGALGGPVGLAITAATFGIGLLIDAFSDATPEANDFASAIDQVTGKLDVLSVIKALPDDFVNKMTQAGVTTNEYADALSQGGASADAFKAKLLAIVEAGTLQFDTENGPITKLSDSAKAAQDVLSQFGSDAEGAAKSTDAFKAKADGAAKAVQSTITPLQVAAANADLWGKANDTAAKALQKIIDQNEVSQVIKTVADETASASHVTDFWAASLDKVGGKSRQLVDAQSDAGRAIASVTDLVKDGGDAYKVSQDALSDFNVAQLSTTEAGQSVVSSLLGAKDAYTQLLGSTYAATAATGDLTAAQQATRDAASQQYAELLKVATQMTGGNVDAAKTLLAQLGILDGQEISDKDFDILADDTDARLKLAGIVNTKLQDKMFNVIAQDLASAGISQVQSISIDDKTVTVKVNDHDVRTYKPDPITGELRLIPKVDWSKVDTRMPSFPGYSPQLASAQQVVVGFAGGTSLQGRAGGPSLTGPVLTVPVAVGGRGITINVSGALDAPAVARQIREILIGQDNRMGVVVAR